MRKTSYRRTILENQSFYAGKEFLLERKDGIGVSRNPDNDYIIVSVNEKSGELKVVGIEANSLSEIGRILYGKKEASVPQMLSRLISPEMEIERIFNEFRYGYVSTVFKFTKNIRDIRERLNPRYNELFTTIIGGSFRNDLGGSRKRNVLRQNNISKKGIPCDFDKLTKELDDLIKTFFWGTIKKEQVRFYRELIAMKPGFHEMWIDKESHYEKAKECLISARDDKLITNIRRYGVLVDLHGGKGIKNVPTENINHEINAKKYRQYSQCHATEGPCFMRIDARQSITDIIKSNHYKELKRSGSYFCFSNRIVVFDYKNAINERNVRKSDVLNKMKLFLDYNLRRQPNKALQWTRRQRDET